jgi:hypothetical protein
LADDLNSDLVRSEKIAWIFARSSRDRAVEAHCMVEGTATDRFSGPPINRTARGGVDPIPLRLLPRIYFAFATITLSLSLSLSLSLLCRSDLVTAAPLRPPVQFQLRLDPSQHRLSMPCFSGVCALRPCAKLDPTQTLAVRWRRRELPSRTRKRCRSGQR